MCVSCDHDHGHLGPLDKFRLFWNVDKSSLEDGTASLPTANIILYIADDASCKAKVMHRNVAIIICVTSCLAASPISTQKYPDWIIWLTGLTVLTLRVKLFSLVKRFLFCFVPEELNPLYFFLLFME